MSIIWIWFGIAIIMFVLSTEAHGLYKMFININNFTDGHLSFNPTILNDNIYTPDKSIKEIIFNLNVNNYIGIISLVFLMLQIILKFHFKKNINNIFLF